MAHAVIHGGGFLAVPVDGMGRRPGTRGFSMVDAAPGHPDGGRGEGALLGIDDQSDEGRHIGIGAVIDAVRVPEDEKVHALAVPGGRGHAVHELPLHRVRRADGIQETRGQHDFRHGVGGGYQIRGGRVFRGGIEHLAVHPLHPLHRPAKNAKSWTGK